MHNSRKNKNDMTDFLISDEQTEQNFRRAAIERDYVPKTDYSDFVENQAHETKNTKKRGAGLFRNLAMRPATAARPQNPASELKDNG